MKIKVQLIIRHGKDGQPLPVLTIFVGEDSYRVYQGEPIKDWHPQSMTLRESEIDIA
jgi:hypothetical protein